MRNHSTSERIAFKWKTDKETEYNNSNVVYINVKKNQLGYTEYTMDLSEHAGWKDAVTRARILPAVDSVTGSAEIDYIAFTKN